MSEQNKNEKKPVTHDATQKEVQTRAGGASASAGGKGKMALTKEKKFYLLTAIGCAVALLAIIVVAIAVSGGGKVDNQAANSSQQAQTSEQIPPQDSTGNTNDEPVVNTPEGMISPVATATLGSDYGFYHNQTLNIYCEHVGVDFTAAAGTQVLAADDGTIESIYKDDVLLGTEIVINHGNGLKTVYRFVTEADGIKVGDKVQKGDVIATIAEASGEEYKEGAHLHFEVLQNDKHVDPATHLTLEEK